MNEDLKITNMYQCWLMSNKAVDMLELALKCIDANMIDEAYKLRIEATEINNKAEQFLKQTGYWMEEEDEVKL